MARVHIVGDSRGFVVNWRFVAAAALIALGAFAVGTVIAIYWSTPT
ncbi:MAG TPA: hypothetical protein VGM28_04740 [Candidatus Limnocylindrales bacterium]